MRLPDGPTLDRFLRALEALGDPEEFFASDRESIVVSRASPGCSRILFTTKQHGLLGLRIHDPDGTGRDGIISRYGLVTAESAAFVAAEASRCGAGIVFAGDLDPHDLTIFLTLAVELSKIAVQVRYLGINDAWIALCHRFLPEPNVDHSGRLPSIALDAYEQEHLRLLDRLPMSWAEIVGPKSMDMLRSGAKLALEGASNPGCYRAGFSAELERFLFPPP